MVTKVTEGIKISVETQYRDDYSNPHNFHYLFSYKITIENQNEFAVQLMRRHWYINDSSGDYREVEGEGVVGQQPILENGDVYEYESACNLTTDIGTMRGEYLFKRTFDEQIFKVNIPEFKMVVPYRMN
jgi:ApaG protein